MSERDYTDLLKMANEAKIRREAEAQRVKIYIGANGGTYGVGVNVGIIF
jgi:hypothetical protein